MGGLVKDATTTIVSEATPALSGLAAVPFRMYATPLPQGYAYRQVMSGATKLPNSASTFANWSPIVEAPTEYATIPGAYEFRSLEELTAEQTSGSVTVPSSWVPVYAGDPPALTGYNVPKTTSVELPPRFYGPIAYMEFVTFPYNETAGGYPLGAGPVFTGVFTVPTVSGRQQVAVPYVKNGLGVLVPQTDNLALPPLCSHKPGSSIITLNNFPGRTSVAAQPAVTATDDHVGWNAGANSQEVYDGDLFTRFSVSIAAGGAVGFSPVDDQPVGDYTRLTHCFYFDADPNSGAMRAVPMESGRRAAPRTIVTGEDRFEIRREAGVVSYRINESVVHISNTPSGGELMVGASLYRAGDEVL